MLRGSDPQPPAADTTASRPGPVPAAPAAVPAAATKPAVPLSTTQTQRALHSTSQTHKAVPTTPAPVARTVEQSLPAAASAPTAPVDLADRETRVHAALAQMLDRLSALPELRPAISALHDRTFNDLSSDELAERLERVTNLIGEQRTSLLREKREIEDMLQQIDSRLEAISAFFAFEEAGSQRHP